MKKVLFLLSMFIAVGSAIFAQKDNRIDIVPQENTSFLRSFSYPINTIMPYDNGVIYSASAGNVDAIGVISEGTEIKNVENLQANSVSKLVAWPGDSKAFYYGDADNSYGTELRVFDGTEARMLRNAGHGVEPAVTNVERMQYSNNKILYYYMIQGTFHEINGGYEAIVNQTDGTHRGTSNVEVARDDQGNIVNVRHTSSSLEGYFKGFVEGDMFNYIAAVPGPAGNYSALFEVTDSDQGSVSKHIYSTESEGSTMKDVFAFNDYYLIKETGNVSGINSMAIIDRTNYQMSHINNYFFHEDMPIRVGDKIFCVGTIENSADVTNLRKLIVIENKSPKVIALNNNNITDNVHNLTVSGNRIYFSATDANGANAVYAIDVNESDPTIHLIHELGEAEITSMVAINDGIAFASYNNSINIGQVIVSNGFAASNYMLNRGVDYGFFSWEYVSNMAYNEGYLYINENNVSTGGSDISYHQVDEANFSQGNVEIIIKDGVSSEVIPFATIEIENAFTKYSVTADENGICNFNNIPIGTYSYTLSADGYVNQKKVPEKYFTPLWINAGDNSKELTLYTDDVVASFAFVVYDKYQYNPIMGGGHLGGATVTLKSLEHTFEEISIDDDPTSKGYANFSDVNFGQYEYEVTCDGYLAYKGIFTVNEDTETSGGPSIYLSPTTTLTYLSTVYWSTEDYPYTGGAHILLQNVDDQQLVYHAVTKGSTDEDKEPKVSIDNIPLGEYNYTYSITEHISQSGVINIDGAEDIVIEFEQAIGDFIFEITGNGSAVANATVNLYHVGAVHPDYTGVTDDNGICTLEDVRFYLYRYEIIADGFTTEEGILTWDENYEDYPDSRLTVNMNPPGSIMALITAADLGVPFNGLGGATVTITNTEDASITFTGVTGNSMMDAGMYEFMDVPYGVYDYVVSADGYFSQSGQYTLDAPGIPGIELTLDPEVKSFYVTAYKEGALIDAGINGATVTLTLKDDATVSYTGTTEGEGFDQGSCLFENIPYGEYTYEIVADDYVTATGEHTVGDADEGITAFLKYAYADISVMVMDADMIEIIGATVNLTSVSDEDITFTKNSDDAGLALFENIPFGEYSYTVSQEDYNTVSGTYMIDENTTEGINVTLSKALVVLTITVINRSEELVEDATIAIKSTTDDELDYTAVTDETGTVVITDLPYDVYTYEVFADNYQPIDGEYTIDVDAETELTITLDRRVGVDEVEANVSVYPNPVSDIINIASDSPIESVEIFALNGQKVREVKTGNLNQIRVSDIPAGIYLIKIYDINGNIILRKVNKL